MKRKHIWKAMVLGVALAIVPMAMVGYHNAFTCSKVRAAEMTHEEKGQYGFLSWPQNLNAVRYEVEIFAGVPKNLQADKEVPDALYRNPHVYSHHVMLDMSELPENTPLFWRVRAFDLDGNPVTEYSQPAELNSSLVRTDRNAPIPHEPNKGPGAAMLFPVYAYTGNPGAVRYEVEVTKKYPENLTGYAPSRYRVYAASTELTDLYDAAPRIGTYYWRVRGMDEKGLPVGEWSVPQEIQTLPEENWEVGIFGDSISHGGGHLSFSPSDLAYSYESYLNFPSINLSESGNTSEMMVDRFERDVLPFHPKVLLIMGGTNSLRGGVPAASVISDLQEIQQKARDNGIIPILLTLPPINPENIQKAFQEPTAEGWQDAFREVNDYIRTQPHIDVAAPFEDMEELPIWLALDGLHGDWNMKQIMADVINRELPLLVGSLQ